jgi:zinc transport system substrate-binding protein
VGAKTLVLNPIGGLTSEEIKAGEDYFSIMQRNLENLKKALTE